MNRLLRISLAGLFLGLVGTSHAESERGTLLKVAPLTLGFETNKADVQLGQLGKSQCAQVAQEMNNYPFAKLELEGFADSTGPVSFNQKLSNERARAVRQLFVERYGIAPE